MGHRALVGGAVVVGVVVGGAGHRRRHVRLHPDVVDHRVTVEIAVVDAVARIPSVAIGAWAPHKIVGLHGEFERLEISVDDTSKGRTDDGLLGIARVHRAAGEEVGDEAGRQRFAEEVAHLWVDEPLGGDVEVASRVPRGTELGIGLRCVDAVSVVVPDLARLDLAEVGRVGRTGVVLLPGHGRKRQATEKLTVKHPSPVGVVNQTARPVDADVVPVIPTAIDRVFTDDVAGLARGGVVVVANVEVRQDAVGRDNEPSLRTGRTSTAPIGTVNVLVGLAGEEDVLLDLPADPIDVVVGAHGHHRLVGGRVDDEVLHVELWVVSAVGVIVADQPGFLDRSLLEARDGRSLLRAVSRPKQHGNGERKEREPVPRSAANSITS